MLQSFSWNIYRNKALYNSNSAPSTICNGVFDPKQKNDDGRIGNYREEMNKKDRRT